MQVYWGGETQFKQCVAEHSLIGEIYRASTVTCNESRQDNQAGNSLKIANLLG